MKVIRLLLILVIINSSSCNKPKYNLTIKFQIDNSQISINDDFKLYFLGKKDKLEANVEGNHVTLPHFSENVVTAVCQYKNYKLVFEYMQVDMLRIDQNMNWTFKILTKDFDQLATSRNLGPAKKIYVWEFNPQDHGEGIEIIVPVYK
jgi:hypothetical protein